MNHQARIASWTLAACLLASATATTHAQAPRPEPGGATPLDPGRGVRPTPTFFPDANLGGQAPELRLLSLAWGRLVDVHALAPGGGVDPEPVHRDLVIREDVGSDGADYLLFRSRLGGRERLVVLRGRDHPDFRRLVRQTTTDLDPVQPQGGGGPLVSFVARNATLVARFDDLLDDSPAAAATLLSDVKVRVGSPPTTPFPARILFDPNHGGVRDGEFHSTRVLIDLTVDELDEGPQALPINAVGLPPSQPFDNVATAMLRIPTELHFPSGQFSRLHNLAGAPLATVGNEPFDPGDPTLPVVRAMRAGNETDVNRGFLFDATAPRLMGTFPVTVDAAVQDPALLPGRGFLVDLTFQTPCFADPRPGDVLSTGLGQLEVLAAGGFPDAGGTVRDVRVFVSGSGTLVPGALVGPAVFAAPFRPALPIDAACWLQLVPGAAQPPATGVDPALLVSVLFNEPLEAGSIRPHDALVLAAGPAGAPLDPRALVPGEIALGVGSAGFAFVPVLPLDHVQGTAETYRVELAARMTDLVGRAPARLPDTAELTLDPTAPTFASAGVVLRFAGPDELEPAGAPDLRGQFFFDLGEESLRPRPVSRFALAADRTEPIPSLMIPFPPGVQTPLSPLGSKLHSVWRYADFGLTLLDETFHNLDVEGLNWSPIAGAVIADFFERFEIRLAHASRLPDEDIDFNLLPRYPSSGLLGAPNPFTENILDDPEGPQTVVHPRALGYTVSPVDLFVAANGTTLLPYPLNRGPGPSTTYTWRDTAILAEGGPNGTGVPLDREVGPPLFLDPGPPGAFAPAGEVPSIGLPLLMEYRTFPSNVALGLNALDISLAINSSAQPNFRAFSTGGFNTLGQPVLVDPDLELVPQGGFNPNSVPPGRRTRPAENSFYIGQLDAVVRVSRAHSVWIDSELASPDWVAVLLDAESAGASGVVAAFRGADGFSPGAGDAPFDASRLDPYGDVEVGSVDFFLGDGTWRDDIDDVDGARFVQVRLTWTNDIETGGFTELFSLALSYR